MENQKYGFTIRVPATRFLEYGVEEYFIEHVRKEIYQRIASTILPTIFNDNNYHVLKFDLYSRDCFDDLNFATEYTVVVRHSLAQQLDVSYMVASPIELHRESKPCCVWCGNELILDSRGGCSACGGFVDTREWREK